MASSLRRWDDYVRAGKAPRRSWFSSITALSSAPKRRARLESQSQVSITITAESEPHVLL